MSKAKQGEKHPKSKFTDKTALKIKKLRKRGYKYRDLARLFDCSISDIGNIATRAYSHLNDKI